MKVKQSKFKEGFDSIFGKSNKNMDKSKNAKKVVPPVYGDAIESEQRTRKIARKTYRDLERKNRGMTQESPSAGKKVKNAYTERLTLDESLFESTKDDNRPDAFDPEFWNLKSNKYSDYWDRVERQERLSKGAKRNKSGDFSYGELIAIESEWEKFKEKEGSSDADTAWKFIEQECSDIYNEEEQYVIFSYISVLEELEENDDEMNESKRRGKGKKLDENAKIIGDLDDYRAWSGAISTYNRIIDEDKLDDLDALIEELYPEGISATGLNDLLWFESDWVFEMLGMKSEDEDEEEEYEDEE